MEPAPGPASRSLLRNRDFVKLWTGETISLLGTQITFLALPLAALLVLRVSPVELGLLGVAEFAPFLLFSLPAGAIVDRLRRRPILIAANLGRAVLLGLVPLFALTGMLRIELLYAVAFLTGTLAVFFDLAYLSYLPALVDRDQLIDANSKLQASASVAQVGGPGLAGLLVQLVTAPMALLLDALSYLASAGSLLLIRAREGDPDRPARTEGLRHEIVDGFRVTFGSRILRAMAGEAASFNALGQGFLVVYLVYAVREIGLSPAAVGAAFAIGSVGAVLGSVGAGGLARRIGVGRAMVASALIGGLPALIVPFASGPPLVVFALVALSWFLGSIGIGIGNVHFVSVRQTITPDRLLGRMNASYRLFTYGGILVGALLGGILGEQLGLRAALLVIALAMSVVPALFLLLSPLPRVRHLDEAPRIGDVAEPALAAEPS